MQVFFSPELTMKCRWLPLVAGILLAAITGFIVHGESAFDDNTREADFFYSISPEDFDEMYIDNVHSNGNGMTKENQNQDEDDGEKFNRILEPQRIREVILGREFRKPATNLR